MWSRSFNFMLFSLWLFWRDARAVESGSLENCCAGNCTVGSNPTPSAIVRYFNATSQNTAINFVKSFIEKFRIPL